MAYIEERKTKDGKTHSRVLIRLKGYPKASATFDRITDAKKWAQKTEVAMRERLKQIPLRSAYALASAWRNFQRP